MKNMILVLATLVSWTARAQLTPPAVTAPSFVTTVQNDEQENLLADNFGRTLYIFDVDNGSNTSKCVGDCAEVWPPYILSAAEAATLTAPLGTVVRTNKKLQLTYDGKPVYTYDLDRVKGDDHGDGIGGVWHYVELEVVN